MKAYGVATQRYSRDNRAIEGLVPVIKYDGPLEVLVVSLGASPEETQRHAEFLYKAGVVHLESAFR